MKKMLIWIFLSVSLNAFAEERKIFLAKVSLDRKDTASIKRGATFFAANCMSCHTLVYLRYNKLAKEAGITYERMPLNVKTWPFGIKPPDLSLEAKVRGVDWIYTYLHSFYVDTTRPTGFNNLLVMNTVMSGILMPYQGQQFLTDTKEGQWYDILVLQKQGSMTPQQFDDTIKDVVNFLAYAAEPYRAEQEKLGFWVIGFLIIFFVLIYLLKKEYWKEVEKD